LLILAVSSVPRLSPPVSWTGADKLAHVAEYGVLGALLRRAARSRGRWSWLFAVGIAAAVGGLDEIYQSTVPGRFSSPYDWLADLAGALIGALLFSAIMGHRHFSREAGGATRKERDRS
jgi:VanZ family protein